MINKYTNPLLSGKDCLIHDEFIPNMDMFCQYLKLCGISAYINSSYRVNSNNLTGAVVKPATHSNHFVGYAIDCNLIDKKGTMWSSEAMKHPAFEILDFINLIRRSPLLRWGGDFAAITDPACDPVHFDYPLNINNPSHWQEIYNELHPNQ